MIIFFLLGVVYHIERICKSNSFNKQQAVRYHLPIIISTLTRFGESNHKWPDFSLTDFNKTFISKACIVFKTNVEICLRYSPRHCSLTGKFENCATYFLKITSKCIERMKLCGYNFGIIVMFFFSIMAAAVMANPCILQDSFSQISSLPTSPPPPQIPGLLQYGLCQINTKVYIF